MVGEHRSARRCRRACAAVGGLSLLAVGCGAVGPGEEGGPHERAADLRTPATPPLWASRAPALAACNEPTPLLVHHDSAGRVDRVHATLTARGQRGQFLVDTGSLHSFATHDGDEQAAAADTVIACVATSLPIIARLRPGTTPDGEPQAGVIGSDLVAHGAVLDLDLARRTLLWYSPAPAIPEGAVALPIEYRNGWLVASGIRLEGRDVKLVVDTGASNVVVVDRTPRTGEVREDTVDGTATAITLWHGDGEISFAGGAVRHVPVDRTDAFATLEGLIAELGGDVVGLLGITALGRERIIISRDAMVLVLPPISPNPL